MARGENVQRSEYLVVGQEESRAKTEVVAGITTFLTMAYIIFVQPAVLSTDLAGRPTGLDFGAVLVATCAASAFASIFMGLFVLFLLFAAYMMLRPSPPARAAVPSLRRAAFFGSSVGARRGGFSRQFCGR